nr:hypothetical protein [Tanacetum cinerariifolium]
MAWFPPMVSELHSTSKSANWEPMFVLYCQRSAGEDYRLARKINKVAMEVNGVVMVKDQLIEELDSLGTQHVPSKMAEFLREIQRSDKETVAKLQILVREMELNAQTMLFYVSIEVLYGLIPNVFFMMNNDLYDIEFNGFRWDKAVEYQRTYSTALSLFRVTLGSE